MSGDQQIRGIEVLYLSSLAAANDNTRGLAKVLHGLTLSEELGVGQNLEAKIGVRVVLVQDRRNLSIDQCEQHAA